MPRNCRTFANHNIKPGVSNPAATVLSAQHHSLPSRRITHRLWDPSPWSDPAEACSKCTGSSSWLGQALRGFVNHARQDQEEPDEPEVEEMETAVRWSQSSVDDDERFLFVEVVRRSFKLCKVRSRRKGVLQYEVIAEHNKVPLFRAFDWSTVHEGIVAVGQSSGEATVLRIDDESQAVLNFPLRNQRPCNAIAFNNQGLLAAGLDKVRTDHCLNIWDLSQQLPSGDADGFATSSGRIHPDPLHKLASSEPITSIKFFQSEPHTLVAGVKHQFVRLYDLRESPGSASMQFATRCVSNIAIDSMDQNYFASCHPTNGVICIWDRRAGSRPPVTQTGFFSASPGEANPLRTSLELKNAVEAPGAIWSLRFSNTRRGCLGMLSHTGHFKTYDIGKEFQSRHSSSNDANNDENQAGNHDDADPEELYLNGIRDLQHAYYHPKEGRPEAERIVSFDFMNLGGTCNEPKVITLAGNGCITELSIPMVPEPEVFSSLGLIHKGEHQKDQLSNLVKVSLDQDLNARSVKRVKLAAKKPSAPIGTVIQYVRCINGYLFSLRKNQTMNHEFAQLRDFWSWVEWAHKEHLAGNMVQENLDLSYIGVYAIWMNDLGKTPFKTRNLGPSSIDMAEAVENLVSCLNIPASKTCSTDYDFRRRLCLYFLQQSWTYEQLEKIINELVSQNYHTKAAAMAVFAREPKLAHRVLRSSSVRFHRMLALAIASAGKRPAGNDDDNDDEWSENIDALARDLADPFARAILAFLKRFEWNAVIEEDTLPLSYRIGVAVRWLDDSELTQYIPKITKEVVSAGNLEGVALTGLGTQLAFELLGNYASHSGDLQTAVLALTWTIPRYIDDSVVQRKFLMWRETYRDYMNSWNLHFNRVDFDIISSRLAVDASGKRLLESVKPQVALTCGYCNQSIAQFEDKAGEDDAAATTRKTQRHPLTAEKAAAIGTVCPKCGRRLPRCGVCDMELGMPDPSYLKWSARSRKLGSADLSASIAGSVMTTLGPSTTRTKPESESPIPNRPKSGLDVAEIDTSRRGSDLQGNFTQETAASKMVDEDMLRKFIAFCIKCSHGFHANHATDWFRGVNGRPGHSVCPVSECSCVCDV